MKIKALQLAIFKALEKEIGESGTLRFIEYWQGKRLYIDGKTISHKLKYYLNNDGEYSRIYNALQAVTEHAPYTSIPKLTTYERYLRNKRIFKYLSNGDTVAEVAKTTGLSKESIYILARQWKKDNQPNQWRK